MPTYEYRCTSCGNDFDVVQKFSDPALTTCDECGGALRKVYNPVGVVFKGSGFYATDNRTKGTTAASSTSGDAPPASASSSADSSKATAASSTSTPAGGESKPAASTTPASSSSSGTTGN